MKPLTAKSIQSQLIMYFTIAIIIPAVITSIVGVKLIYDQIITRAETKVLSDLSSAREIYLYKISHIESVVRLTGARSLVIKAVSENDKVFLQKDLLRTLKRERLDILTVVDKNGKVISRGRNPNAYGDTLLSDVFVERAIKTKQIVSGTNAVSEEQLLKESSDLAKQVYMDIIPTPKAKPRTSLSEKSGMMLQAVTPIFDDSNVFQGVLIGGILLNRNFEIVDKIKTIMQERELYKGKEIGTATIFQNDLRISTNVKNEDGTVAIATLVSEEVNDAVLRDGERWIGDAFVVNTWYIGAYEPIRDIQNKIIGILYVGTLKEPFNDLLRNTLMTFLGITLIGMFLVVLVSIFQAKKISNPLKQLEGIAVEITAGNYNQEFKLKAPREIEHLASSLDCMAKELENEKRELEEWANKLEKKVEERTNEIKKIHSQLFRSEKLASLGKLAAGVAHEINNPLTGILTNSSLLLEDLSETDPKREDVEVIVKETIRCREIVKRLLDFAKQIAPQKKLTNINTLIENIILLVRNQTSFRNIKIEKNLSSDIPDIMIDPDQVQQVFINIILNASEAMTRGGELTIDSKMDSNGNSIVVSIKDTGPGIPEHLHEKIFDPFFTTKEQGTGLGLSISYGIIEQHGGTINLETEIAKGTTFTIQLPIDSLEND